MPTSPSTTAGLVRTCSLRPPKTIAPTSINANTTATATASSSKTNSYSTRNPVHVRRTAVGTSDSTTSVSTLASVTPVESSEAHHHPTNPTGARQQPSGSPGPSRSLKLFLANLRALDLDLRPDWPDISPLTFASSASSLGQKKRVQSVEWALFYLFKLWDPEECRTKLQLLFPPNDQVQSLNLRAALLRCLDQAKKNGVLSRETIIRKTMLDDCKGERLEEVLASFSAAVLKKVVAENPHSRCPAIAQTLALENRGISGEGEEIPALILAHKASLSRQLREKQKTRGLYQDLSELLDVKERTLARRQEQLKAVMPSEAVTPQQKSEVNRMVRNNWAGNDQWMEALLHGDGAEASKDPFLNTPFDKVWRRLHADRLSELEEKPKSLLDQLDLRIQAQQERLAKWQDFRERIFGTSENRPINTNPVSTRRTSRCTIDLHFTAHTDLSSASAVASSHRKADSSLVTTLPTMIVEAGDYSSLIRDFYADMAAINETKHTSLSSQSWVRKISPRKPYRSPIASQEPISTANSSSSEDPASSRTSESPPSRHIRSASIKSPPRMSPPRVTLPNVLTTDSVESSLQLHPPISSWGKSVERPIRVRRGDETPVRKPGPRRMPSPKPPPKIGAPGFSKEKGPGMFPGLRKSSGSIMGIKFSSGISVDSRVGTKIITTSMETKKPTLVAELAVLSPGSEPPRDAHTLDGQVEEILEAMQNASPSPTRKIQPCRTMSLADRTRLSIMKTTSLDLDLDQDTNPEQFSPSVEVHAPEIQPPDDEPMGDLVARTRKSMAGFEAAQKKAQVDRRRSLRLQRTASRKDKGKSRFDDVPEECLNVPQTGDVLDADEELSHEMSFLGLMDSQEDYEAVFRSRPKIKTSPAPSPSRMGFGS
ncbi:hypothetical protein CFIMG_002322RA [Ceratocystis fimbriata CBS 114723]|uniref:HAUS augmin-like complex subunit 6 N-terminal domain-containing protein n=1 Tax=Ceratocystis fimbriata CBS 114723 TaxID=1035309 RepID=A0A2C5X4C7_9PEZI|nr:hypothetical protein CFIMG_002322RA [Ceratocystis fimbriata CBS 114723]